MYIHFLNCDNAKQTKLIMIQCGKAEDKSPVPDTYF